MLKRNIITAVLLFIVALCPAFSAKEGQKAPAIIMKASNGDVFNPAKSGKSKLLVISFFSSDCLPCIKEIPELQKLQDESSGIAVYLVADTGTDEKAAGAFLGKIEKTSGMAIRLPLVYDVYSDMKQSFEVKSFPSLFLVDKKGAIVLRQDGYRPENIEELKQAIKKL